ncbi:MAG TPA: DUF4214 domain-containing protein, partial [Iamia sp.]|nr:DUF4214 domain-containing protein [Iamia sp.]
LAPAQPSLLGHFRQTADGQTAKAPAPLGVNVTFLEPDPAVLFVEALYRAVLDRSPGEGELAYWVDRLHGGTSPVVVGTSVATSSEARRRLVVLDYAALDRSPGAGEVTYWAGRLAAGLTAESLVVQLLASPEGIDLWESPAGLAEAAYQVYLHRAGDAGGLAYWAGRLESQGTPAGVRSVLTAFGRTAAATRAAIVEAFGTACSTFPTSEPNETAAFEAAWVQSGRNPLRLAAFAVGAECPEGPVTD